MQQHIYPYLSNKSRTGVALLIVPMIMFASCKKFVDVPPPVSQLVTTTVFQNGSTATAAQTTIYSQMFNDNQPYNVSWLTGLSGDELTNYSTYGPFISFYQNTLNPTNGLNYNLWSSAYSYIYQANALIEGLNGSTAINTNIKQQLTGEAEFVRAFWYFYLVNLYGDVPLITSTNYKGNAVAARTSKSLVYTQIITDLKNAGNLVNSNYVDVSDTTVTSDRVRPNKAAVAALLARVYLYVGNLTKDAGNYTTAEAAATVVINNPLYNLAPLNGVFLANSSEAIWQLQPVANGYNTLEGEYYILTGPPSSGSGIQTSALSNELVNTFEPGDNRKSNWVGSVGSGSATYYFPYKYKISVGANLTEYSMVLRLAEQYLIRAEARAQLGETAQAIADINVIRNRAGLSNYAGATDKGSLLAAITHERQVELFTEWGHRWLDLKRTGNIDATMATVAPLKGGTWNTNWQYYPIPQTERNSDGNLTQNAGY
jgi:hypothetical protein